MSVSFNLVKETLMTDALTSNIKTSLSKPYIHVLLIAALGLFIYANTFNVPFTFDDKPSIVTNTVIRDFHVFIDPSKLASLDTPSAVKSLFKTRFIGYLSFAADYWLHGLDVTGYHVINLLIHIINAILIYWLVLLTFQTPFFSKHQNADKSALLVAFFSALLFVCHPVQTQSVTYIVQRFTSLATLFYILSIVSYVKSRVCNMFMARYFFYSVSLISAILAMFTKEISFTLPLVITLYDFCFFQDTFKKRILYLLPILLTSLIIPIVLVGFNIFLLDINSIDNSLLFVSGRTISKTDYLFTQFRVIITYIRLLLFPVSQNLDYDYPIYHSFFTSAVFLSFIMLSLIFTAAMYLFHLSRIPQNKYRYCYRIIAFGIFFFFIALSVESGIIPIFDVIFEHRIYLPSIGLIISIVASLILLRGILKAKKIYIFKTIIPLLIAIVFVFSVAAHARNETWKTAIGLWEDSAIKSPNKPRPHYNLCLLYLGQGRYDDAIKECTIAINKNHDFADAHNNLGVAYRRIGQSDLAMTEFQTAARLTPNDINIRRNLGLSYEEHGSLSEAVEEFRVVMQYNPLFINELNNFGVTLYQQGNLNAAIQRDKIVIKLKPDLDQAHYNLALAYKKQNHLEQAVTEFKTTISLNPNLARAHYNLALVLRQQGKLNAAAIALESALKLQPDYADARQALDSLLIKRK